MRFSLIFTMALASVMVSSMPLAVPRNPSPALWSRPVPGSLNLPRDTQNGTATNSSDSSDSRSGYNRQMSPEERRSEGEKSRSGYNMHPGKSRSGYNMEPGKTQPEQTYPGPNHSPILPVARDLTERKHDAEMGNGAKMGNGVKMGAADNTQSRSGYNKA